MNKRSRCELHSACWIQQYEISSLFNDALSVRFMHFFVWSIVFVVGFAVVVGAIVVAWNVLTLPIYSAWRTNCKEIVCAERSWLRQLQSCPKSGSAMSNWIPLNVAKKSKQTETCGCGTKAVTKNCDEHAKHVYMLPLLIFHTYFTPLTWGAHTWMAKFVVTIIPYKSFFDHKYWTQWQTGTNNNAHSRIVHHTCSVATVLSSN